MAGETSDATVLIITSVAMETGGVKNSPRAKAAVGAAVFFILKAASQFHRTGLIGS